MRPVAEDTRGRWVVAGTAPAAVLGREPAAAMAGSLPCSGQYRHFPCMEEAPT